MGDAMPTTDVLYIPGSNIQIHPGDKVKLHRFDSQIWIVKFGWYSFGGNRAVCGWYLQKEFESVVKPIFQIDLDDIYVISIG